MRRIRTRGAAVPLIAAVAVLAMGGCGDDEDEPATESPPPAQQQQTSDGAGGSGEPPPRAQKVEMLDFEFSPPSITIATGGKVIWLNQGQAPHDATADDDSFATGTIEPGKLQAETFKEPGTYSYICTIHPQMTGTIEVTG